MQITNTVRRGLLDHIDDMAAPMWAAGIKLRCIAVAMAYDDPRAVVRLSWPLCAGGLSHHVQTGVSMTAMMAQDTLLLLPRCTEAAILDAAWRLGAWDVLRTEHPPIPRTEDEAVMYGFVPPIQPDALGNPLHPAWGLTAAFTGRPYEIDGQDMAIGSECPPDLIDAAATRGWVTWYFKPTKWSARVGINDDRTLNPDGGRDEREIPIMPAALRHRPHQYIYRLGRAPHGNRSKAKAQRRAAV